MAEQKSVFRIFDDNDEMELFGNKIEERRSQKVFSFPAAAIRDGRREFSVYRTIVIAPLQ